MFYTVNLFFSCYVAMLFLRVIGSWLPFREHAFMRFIAHYTDPYLNLFRRIIPPIGGMLDISPILAFLALSLMKRIILSFLQ